jgi:hypothetical protein
VIALGYTGILLNYAAKVPSQSSALQNPDSGHALPMLSIEIILNET